jgi:DNA-binding MarR family transcriptional regulator
MKTRPPRGPQGDAGRGPTSTAPHPVGAQPDAVWEELLQTVQRLTRTLEDGMKAEGYVLSWYQVLSRLAAAPGGRLRMQQLADDVILTRGGLTRLVDRLEARELVRRGRDEDDRRGAYAVLTERGREAYRRLATGYHRDLNRHFGRHLSRDDLRALQQAIAKVRAGHPE